MIQNKTVKTNTLTGKYILKFSNLPTLQHCILSGASDGSFKFKIETVY